MVTLWATKSEDVGLSVRAVSFQDFQLLWSWSTNVTDGQTDGQTMQSQYRALHYKLRPMHRAVTVGQLAAGVTHRLTKDESLASGPSFARLYTL